MKVKEFDDIQTCVKNSINGLPLDLKSEIW
jgi:hypothetical protein